MLKPILLVLTLCLCLFLGGCRTDTLTPATPESSLPESPSESPSASSEVSQAPIEPSEEDRDTQTSIDSLDEEAQVSTESSQHVPQSEPVEVEPVYEPEPVYEAASEPQRADRDSQKEPDRRSQSDAEPEPSSSVSEPVEPAGEPATRIAARGELPADAVPPSAFGAQEVVTVQGGTTSYLEAALLELINAAREESGLPALGVEESMQFAASIRAEEVLESLSHTRPDGTPYYTAFDEAGFVYAGKWHGENLASIELQDDTADDAAIAQALFDEWSRSPGHEQNMLGENFVQTGIGVYIQVDDDGVRIGSAQLFAGL